MRNLYSAGVLTFRSRVATGSLPEKTPCKKAKQETQTQGDQHRGERVLPDRVFYLVRGLHRLVLNQTELIVGDAAHLEARLCSSARIPAI